MTSSHCSRALALLLLTVLAPVHFAAADNRDWMRWLPDSTNLADLSIPGTHDTMANEAPASTIFDRPWVLTQDQELNVQLNQGVRALDIRARHIGDRFTIHHGAYYVAANFDDVLRASVQFLREHPAETLLMRVKQEHEAESTTRSFIDTFRWYRDQPAYSAFIWRGTALPTLGQVRGKIVILDDFSGGAHGIRWGSLDIQDAYTESNTGTKWGLVLNQLNAADAGPRDRMYVNFLSATGINTPHAIAQRLNAEAHNYLVDGDGVRTGLLMADFAPHWLMDAIIPLNSQGGIPSYRGGNGQYQPGTTLEFGIDRPGSDYMHFALQEARPELCRSACFADASRCKSFSYVAPGHLGVLQALCYLKSSVPAAQSNADVISGTTMTNPAQGLYSGQVELSVDRPGMDYRVFTLAETRPELCREACLQDANTCKSFTYVRPGKKSAAPLCFLKRGVPAPLHEPECDSGVNTGAPDKKYTAVGTTLEFGVDRQGQDYRAFEPQEARPEVCREACFDDAPRCKAFTYVRPGLQGTQARCYLKSGLPTPTLNAGTVSGTTLSPRNVGLISGLVEMNVDRLGQDYRLFDLQEARPELCREACIADAQRCRAFSYVKPGVQGPLARCYLKSGAPAPSAFAGADSGVIPRP